MPDTHWLVKFNEGNTETGSSGSPLFDEKKHVVGQLHGGSDTESLYGKFSLSWNYSSVDSQQLKHWLDPDNTGLKILDGIGQKPPIAKFAAEIQDVCTNTSVSFIDQSENRPTQWSWNIQPSTYNFVNGTDSSSQNPEIEFLEDGVYSVTLSETNKYGADEITLQNYILAKSKLDVSFLKAKTDSIMLHVVVQSNDNIANASRLSLGNNAGFSNQCATVEAKEPFPPTSGCLLSNNWCPDQSGSGSVLNNSIWFTFISPSSGQLNINTSGFDDQIALYDADSYNSLLSGNKSLYNMVAANDNSATSDNSAQLQNLVLEPLKQYWLQVDGDNKAFGDLEIDLVSNSIEVYPNPSAGIFNLIISSPVDGMVRVFLYDFQGRKLFERQYEVRLASNKFNLDLSGFAQGMYLLNVQMNGLYLSKKLICW